VEQNQRRRGTKPASQMMPLQKKTTRSSNKNGSLEITVQIELKNARQRA